MQLKNRQHPLFRIGLFLFCSFATCTFCSGEEPKKRDDPKKEETKGQCKAPFVSNRMVPEQWYRDNGFGDPVKCEEPKTKDLKRGTSIPLYWVIAGKTWKDDEVKEKLDAAKDWFDIYCIKLDFREIPIKANERKNLIALVNKHNGEKGEAFANDAREALLTLWTANLKKPKPKFLMILFVDEFTEVKYSNAVVNVSGNFEDIPLILITHADSGSKHIVTHELVHGLGKALGSQDGKPHSERSKTSDNNTWNEGGCTKEMGNAARTTPTVPMTKSDKAPMDWASYWEYAKGAQTIH